MKIKHIAISLAGFSLLPPVFGAICAAGILLGPGFVRNLINDVSEFLQTCDYDTPSEFAPTISSESCHRDAGSSSAFLDDPSDDNACDRSSHVFDEDEIWDDEDDEEGIQNYLNMFKVRGLCQPKLNLKRPNRPPGHYGSHRKGT